MRTLLHLVLIDETGDSYYRMRWPCRDLALQRNDWSVVALDANASERFALAEEADLLVLVQSPDLDLIPIIERRRAQGKRTLVEYNDNYYAAPPWSPVSKEWGDPLVRNRYEQMIEASDGLIVSSPGLEHLFRSRTSKPITILDNHLPFEPSAIGEKTPSRAPSMHLGWAGSLGHIADLMAVAPLLKSLIHQNPNVVFHAMGNESIPQVLGLPTDRLRFTPWGTMQQYFDFWAPVSLGIVPLIDTPYNQCRSDIKAVEMVGCGVLPIVPDAVPYRAFLHATGLTPYTNLPSLREKIEFYLQNGEALHNELTRCAEYVLANRVGIRRFERAALYEANLGSPSSVPQRAWRWSAGYHEATGTPSDPPSRQTLQMAQELLRAGNVVQAKAILATRSSYHPDVLLSELRLAARTRSIPKPDLDNHLHAAIKKFPRDLRFLLLNVSLCASATERRKGFSALKALIEQYSESERASVESETVAALAPHALESEMFCLTEQFAIVYPNNVTLRYLHAEALAQQGEYSVAAELMSTLALGARNHSQQHEFFEKNDYAFFAARVSALHELAKKN